MKIKRPALHPVLVRQLPLQPLHPPGAHLPPAPVPLRLLQPQVLQLRQPVPNQLLLRPLRWCLPPVLRQMLEFVRHPASMAHLCSLHCTYFGEEEGTQGRPSGSLSTFYVTYILLSLDGENIRQVSRRSFSYDLLGFKSNWSLLGTTSLLPLSGNIGGRVAISPFPTVNLCSQK